MTPEAVPAHLDDLSAKIREARKALSEPHCGTCHCGRRAPVQGRYDYGAESRAKPKGLGDGPGTISWEEHLLAWGGYAREGHGSQGAERMAERGGFGFDELVRYLGRAPTTWRPRGVERGDA